MVVVIPAWLVFLLSLLGAAAVIGLDKQQQGR